ncbi:hypothetical protein JXC34_06140 [Candidatus Woesearchaeota archaeon]|nr:hypothetical protein [Candidatus Woesearchaeota archaeon]
MGDSQNSLYFGYEARKKIREIHLCCDTNLDHAYNLACDFNSPDPLNPLENMILADIFAKSGDYESAFRSYNAALDTNTIRSLALERVIYAEMGLKHILFGNHLHKSGDYAGAMKHINDAKECFIRAIDYEKGEPIEAQYYIMSIVKLVDVSLTLDDLDTAKKALENYRQIDPAMFELLKSGAFTKADTDAEIRMLYNIYKEKIHRLN